MRYAALDVVEDAIELRDWKAAKADFDKNPATYAAIETTKRYLSYVGSCIYR
jgi:hypothetical protein